MHPTYSIKNENGLFWNGTDWVVEFENAVTFKYFHEAEDEVRTINS